VLKIWENASPKQNSVPLEPTEQIPQFLAVNW